jgi:hypothetical protein
MMMCRKAKKVEAAAKRRSGEKRSRMRLEVEESNFARRRSCESSLESE